MTDLPRLLTTTETAEALRLSPATLKHWRWSGKGPAFARIGSRVVYREEDVEAWIEASAVSPAQHDASR